MNAILVAVFGVLAVILGFSKPVLADTTREANTNSGRYTLSGDSLTGIGTVTAEEDFTRFFSNEKREEKDVSDFNQSLSSGDEDVSLEPAEEFTIGNDGLNAQFNDGVKVLFDLGE
ncbi:hypothetical protein [Mastigocoleus testarum]|uniref:Uncharacterized protein n=1 Tax=Mastigocoleus testarum BC008 TaxID=371196 RepID=A0A0V8A087_9CYAN|nr:hypothetical protein [Mastigocoleus testarum]KST70017.1 hypothetical protein BC008_06145 [Mastigocoleus testarum BC008]